MTQKIKYLIDVLLFVMLIFVMSYQLIGAVTHEWIALAMITTFVIHQALNWRWYKNLFRGKYNYLRTISIIINLLILIIIILLSISGIIMSKYVFSSFHFDGASWTRMIHLLLSYWGFFLMSVHVGLHFDLILIISKKHLKFLHNKYLIILSKYSFPLIFIYSLFACYKRQFFNYMFLKKQFVFYNFNEPILYFIFDFIIIFILFMYIGHTISKTTKKLQKVKNFSIHFKNLYK